MPEKRTIRIGGTLSSQSQAHSDPFTNKSIEGCSGAGTDRRDAIRAFAANHPHDPVDVIIGDWLSEANMTVRAATKSEGMRPETLSSMEKNVQLN